MIVGIPKKIKNNENRVGMTPAGVNELVKHGHTVYVQKGAGENSGFPDSSYERVGAKILATIEDVYAISEMIDKGKKSLLLLNIRLSVKANCCLPISILLRIED